MHNPLVLIADDQPETGLILTKYLASAGFSTLVCKDGREALEAARQFRPPIAILDGLMPHIHGFEVCRQIKAIDDSYRPQIGILTAVYRGIRYENEASMKFRVDAYMTKPIDPAAVVRTVNGFRDWLRLNDPFQLSRSMSPLPRLQAASRSTAAAEPMPANSFAMVFANDSGSRS